MELNDLLQGFDWDEIDKPEKEEKEEKEDGTPKEVEAKDDKKDVKESEPEVEAQSETIKDEPVTIKSMLSQVFEVDIEDDIDPDLAIEYTKTLINDKIEEGIQEMVSGWKEAIGETGADFIRWTMNGGSVEDYLKSYNPLLIASDISTEDGQRAFLKKVLIKDGQEEDEVDEMLDMWEGSGKLEQKAASAMKKLQSEDEKARRAQLEKQEQERLRLKKEREDAHKKLKDGLAKVDSALGLPLTKVDRNLLIRDITIPTDSGEPKFISDLKKALSEPEKLLFLAKIVRTGFDPDKITALFEGKAINKVTQKLDEKPPKVKTSAIESSNTPIWDLLDD